MRIVKQAHQLIWWMNDSSHQDQAPVGVNLHSTNILSRLTILSVPCDGKSMPEEGAQRVHEEFPWRKTQSCDLFCSYGLDDWSVRTV